MLYFASIAVALTRCGRRISGLANRDLATGFAWVVGLNWVDEPTRELVREALELVNGGKGELQ